jgi:hypothetical protein
MINPAPVPRNAIPNRRNGIPTKAVMMPMVSPDPTTPNITPSKTKTKAVIAQPSAIRSRHIYRSEIGRGAGGGVGRLSVNTDSAVVSATAGKGPPQFLQLD